MSVLSKLREQSKPHGKKLFGVIAGPRLAGKTTIVGTLKGTTLLMQASVLESGSSSASALANQLGNKLVVVDFSQLSELKAILKELAKDTEFDNIVIDGLSAITEIKMREPEIAALVKKDNWSAFRAIGDEVVDIIIKLKELTYPDKAVKPKTTFLTCALKLKTDRDGSVMDVELETKGNMAVSAVTKFAESVVTVVSVTTDQGTERKLLTKNNGPWPGRIDGLLDSQNPGFLPADLSTVIKLLESFN
jgi:AAA domain-containing protein